MSIYSVYFKPSVEKDLRGLPDLIVSQVMNRIEELISNPFPSNITKLIGTKSTYRIRIKDYRIIYEVDSKEKKITVL